MDFFFGTLNGIHCFPELYRGGTALIQSQQLLRNYWSSWLSFKKRQGDRLAPGILGKAFFTTSKWNLRLCILCFQKLNNTTFASLLWVNPPHLLILEAAISPSRSLSLLQEGGILLEGEGLTQSQGVTTLQVPREVLSWSSVKADHVHFLFLVRGT